MRVPLGWSTLLGSGVGSGVLWGMILGVLSGGCGRVGFDDSDELPPLPVVPALLCEEQLKVPADSLGGNGLSAAVAGATVVVVWKNGGEAQALAIPATGAPIQRVLYENVVEAPSVTAVGDDVVVAAAVDSGLTLVQRLTGELVEQAPRQALASLGLPIGPRALATTPDGGVILLGSGKQLTLRHLDRDGAPKGDEIVAVAGVARASLQSSPRGYALAWVGDDEECRIAPASSALALGAAVELRSTTLVKCTSAISYATDREVHVEAGPDGAVVYGNGSAITKPVADVIAPQATHTNDGGWTMWSDSEGVKVLALTTLGEPAGGVRLLDAPSTRFDVISLGSQALALWRSGENLVLRRLCKP